MQVQASTAERPWRSPLMQGHSPNGPQPTLTWASCEDLAPLNSFLQCSPPTTPHTQPAASTAGCRTRAHGPPASPYLAAAADVPCVPAFPSGQVLQDLAPLQSFLQCSPPSSTHSDDQASCTSTSAQLREAPGARSAVQLPSVQPEARTQRDAQQDGLLDSHVNCGPDSDPRDDQQVLQHGHGLQQGQSIKASCRQDMPTLNGLSLAETSSAGVASCSGGAQDCCTGSESQIRQATDVMVAADQRSPAAAGIVGDSCPRSAAEASRLSPRLEGIPQSLFSPDSKGYASGLEKPSHCRNLHCIVTACMGKRSSHASDSHLSSMVWQGRKRSLSATSRSRFGVAGLGTAVTMDIMVLSCCRKCVLLENKTCLCFLWMQPASTFYCIAWIETV